MYCNMGMKDRYFRIAFGFALMSQAIVGFQNPLFLFGVFPTIIGFTGWCPLFSLVNWSSMTDQEIQQQIDEIESENRKYQNRKENQPNSKAKAA